MIKEHGDFEQVCTNFSEQNV